MRGRIRGAYANSDAAHVTRISIDNVVRCIRGALESAEVDSREVECVNAHATSTWVGDRSELTALGQVFGEDLKDLPVVANKSQLGHSLGASSVLEIILACRGMNASTLLPTLNHEPDPELPKAFVPTEALEYPHATTLINSFGFGGTNVCMVLGKGD